MREKIIAATERAVAAIWHPRFYANERGYQGILYYFLTENLKQEGLLKVPGDRLLEIEYQKSYRHKLTQRPDIIFHAPAEQHGEGVRKHNFAVWALKPAASEKEAKADFKKLDDMFSVLEYPLGFFINMHATRDCLHLYNGRYAERLVGVRVWLGRTGVKYKLRQCHEVKR